MTKLKSKYIVFGVIGVMMSYVLYHNERFLVEPSNPFWEHISSFKWWLLPHGLLGACTLPLAPFQFSNRLRKRFTRAHRVVGRIYVVGALGLAPLGAYIQYYQERMGGPRSFTVLGVVDAVMLITMTAIAFLFAYKRKIKEHQQWMTRSYAVALVFIGGRFVMGVTGWELLSIEIVQAIIWSCLALSVPIADVMNNWREIREALSKAKSRAPALPQQLAEPVVETI
jgi:uncharacterized membrane protein